jgi:hypothetical protein
LHTGSIKKKTKIMSKLSNSHSTYRIGRFGLTHRLILSFYNNMLAFGDSPTKKCVRL